MKELVESRGIDFVWHFTRLTNLPSILANGLINRVQLTFSGIQWEFNDHHRIDGHQDSICCSIAHPNYKMFYRLRQENPETEWVVIGLKLLCFGKRIVHFAYPTPQAMKLPQSLFKTEKGLLHSIDYLKNLQGSQ